MALDAIIFDLDGTLLDTNRAHARAWRLAIEEYGFGLGEDRILKEIGKAGSMFVPDLLGTSVEEEHGQAMRDAHDRIYLEIVEKDGVRAFRGVEDIFEAAHALGLKTAVVTGSGKEGVQKAADAAGIDLFGLSDIIVTDDDVEHGKPCPDGIHAAVDKLELSPAQCALIGDTPFDIEAGSKAGVVTICVETGAHSGEKLLKQGARAVYPTVKELARDLDEAVRIASPGEARFTWIVLRELMEEAIEEARRAADSGDLPVGAVITLGDGTIISRAHSTTETSRNFLHHAEMLAFQNIVGKVQIERRELVLVSTLEPCMMCLGAAMGARVDTIIYGLRAPNNGGARRCDPMQSPGMFMPRIIGGICEDEIRQLFVEWSRLHPDAPFVHDLLARV